MTDTETVQSYLQRLITRQLETTSWAEITRRVHQAGFDIHETTLRNAARPDRTPSVKTLRGLAAALDGADLAYMLRIAGHLDDPDRPSQPPALHPRTLDLALILDTLRPEDQTVIEHLVRLMAARNPQMGPAPEPDAGQ